MNEQQHINSEYRDPSGCLLSGGLLLAILLTVAFALLVSCKPQKEITTNNNHTTQQLDVEKVFIRDSIYTDRWHVITTKGDTVYKHDSIIKYISKHIHDTLRLEYRDTINNVIVETKIESKPLNGWQRFIQGSGYFLWGIVLLAVIALVVKIVLKFYKAKK